MFTSALFNDARTILLCAPLLAGCAQQGAPARMPEGCQAVPPSAGERDATVEIICRGVSP